VSDAEDGNGDLVAWFIRCPGGRLMVRVADGACDAPGAQQGLTAWLRLKVTLLGRPFGVLTRGELAGAAADLVGHTFTTDDCLIPAVRGSAAPLLQRGDECRSPDG
jgi:hypothetical protein